jgi:2-polyprenyl-6-hydroxyphenyl methylase/3-demethylubiquinone-9 3-methyltransferase
MTHPRNTICLWFNGLGEEAAQFYTSIFPDSSVGRLLRAPGDYPA